MKMSNGFATKSDVKRLDQKMDRRFAAVDKRFQQVDERFIWFRNEINLDLENFKKDTYREFEHRWQQLADPILKEVVAMREEQAAHYMRHDRTDKLLDKIAKKVGVK